MNSEVYLKIVEIMLNKDPILNKPKEDQNTTVIQENNNLTLPKELPATTKKPSK
jgi:hypothetical protein